MATAKCDENIIDNICMIFDLKVRNLKTFVLNILTVSL